MAVNTLPGGTFTMAEDLTVTRMGYGAMQLAGPHVFGPPSDREAAVAVLREVIDLGITHIDTSDYYGPHITNQIIKEALYPYPDSLHIVTKVGAPTRRRGGWPHRAGLRSRPRRRCTTIRTTSDLTYSTSSTYDLGGFDGPTPGSVEEPFIALAQMQKEGFP